MGRRNKRLYKVEIKPENERKIIRMNEINIKKSYYSVDFKTGRHMTEKDRPRRKRWDVGSEC